MMLYFTLKYLHVIGAAVLLGELTTTPDVAVLDDRRTA